MGSGLRRGSVLAFAILLASPAAAQEGLLARVKRAQEAARANAASPEGREWTERHSAATDRVMIPLLNQCLPEQEGDIPTAFAVFIRLSRAGRAAEVVTEIDAALGRCMTAAAQESRFPEAPRDDYWIQVNMAASL